jgi:hypothetical protein
VFQVDADGSSNPILIADGSNDPVLITNTQASQTVYDVALYVPEYTLTDSTKRVQVQLFVNENGGTRTAYFEFRSGAISHLHTTIAVAGGSTGPTGPTGPLPAGNYYFVQGQLGTNQTIGAGPDTVIQFTANTDSQGWSSGDASSSFKITPTIEGYYQISLNVRWNPVATAGDQLNNQIHKNNDQIAFTQGTNVTTNSVCLSLTAFTYMNGTTDFIDFKGFSGASGGTVLTSTGTTFSLVLIQGGTSTTPTTGKTFIIDHPLNPNRHLVHACLEGPEVGVYYRGEGTVPSDTTQTTILLPDYVHAIATHFTVQLTPIYQPDRPIATYAASKVVKGSFQVYGPPGTFFWQVHASRGPINVEPLKTSVNVRGDGPYKYLV